MFKKEQIDALFEELKRRWHGEPDYERLVRDAHLGIALFDAGRPLGDELDSRVVALVEKHAPGE